MDQVGIEGEGVTEALLAAMFGFCVWAGLRAYRPVDAAVALRVEQMAGGAGSSTASRESGRLGKLLACLGRRFPGASVRSTQELLAAGDWPVGSVNTVRGAEIVLASTGFVVGLVTGVGAWAVSPALALVGHRLPKTLLEMRSRRRRDQIAVALPDAVDLLVVCAQAGLSVAVSLKRVSVHVPGALGRELQRTLEEVDLGVPRAEALAKMAKRNQVSELEALVGVLNTAERFGIGVVGSLQTFAEEVRIRRRRAAEEQARRAPVKMLFPLVFLILPAFILLTVVPMLLSAFSSLSI